MPLFSNMQQQQKKLFQINFLNEMPETWENVLSGPRIQTNKKKVDGDESLPSLSSGFT